MECLFLRRFRHRNPLSGEERSSLKLITVHATLLRGLSLAAKGNFGLSMYPGTLLTRRGGESENEPLSGRENESKMSKKLYRMAC